MRTYEQTITGGQSYVIQETGGYFRLLAAENCSVKFYQNGKEISDAEGMGSGFWHREPGGFDRVEVKPAVTQTLKLMIGSSESGFDSQPVINGGSVPIVQNITLAAGVQQVVNIAPNAKRLSIRAQPGYVADIWLNFTGLLGTDPYFTLQPGDSYSEDGILVSAAGLNLYVLSVGIGYIEIVYWI